MHQASGSLLLTDALVAINSTPPAIFDLDPTPLLFHARDSGDQPLKDTPELRQKGWERLALFASFLRPEALEVPPLAQLLAKAFQPGCRSARSYFGFFPFQWRSSSREAFEALTQQGSPLLVAPVLERLVFPRARPVVVRWLRELSQLPQVRWLVPAHYDAPVPCSNQQLAQLADAFEQRQWAPSQGNWDYLASIDQLLVRTGVVPSEESP